VKIEIKKMFLLNFLGECSKCLFVDRTAAHGRGSIVHEIKNRVEEFQTVKD